VVYAGLAAGERLNDVVAAARRALHERELSDWANYRPYGDGRFRLVVPRP
jgi:hypothetical protein